MAESTDERLYSNATILVSLFLSAFLALPLSGTEAAGAQGIPPGDLSAVAGPETVKAIPGNGQVVLTWSPVIGATSYNVYRGTAAGGAKASTSPTLRGVVGTTAVIALPNGEYWFAVRAVASNEEGQASKEETPGTPNANAAPSDVKATAKERQIILTWTSVGATTYKVDMGTDMYTLAAVSGLTSIPGTNPTVTATVTGLKDDTTYFFQVSAVDLAGTESPSQKLSFARTPPASASPAATEKPIDINTTPCTNLKAFSEVAQQFATNDTLQPSTGSAKPSIAETNSKVIREIQAVLRQERKELKADSANTKAQAVAQVPPGVQAEAAKELKKALKCNAWLADYTTAQQTTSSSVSVQAFPKFATSLANNSQLVTTHLVSAFMPMWLQGDNDFNSFKSLADLAPHVNSHAINDLGFDISSSVPITSATIGDYARQELLTRTGGLLNMYASLSGRNYSNVAYAWGNRTANLDRLYWVDLFGDTQPASAKEALAFISQGMGVKALKTSLSGTGSIGAQGTAYVGVGFDGPLFLAAQDPTAASKSAENTPNGMASLELYVSENVINQPAVNALLGAKAGGNSYFALGANFFLYVTNNIGIQVQYVLPRNVGVGHSIGSLAMVTLSYTKASTPAPPPVPTGAAAASVAPIGPPAVPAEQ
jgi:hypothetical protein